jgi:hypothetical protein
MEIKKGNVMMASFFLDNNLSLPFRYRAAIMLRYSRTGNHAQQHAVFFYTNAALAPDGSGGTSRWAGLGVFISFVGSFKELGFLAGSRKNVFFSFPEKLTQE